MRFFAQEKHLAPFRLDGQIGPAIFAQMASGTRSQGNATQRR